MKLRNKVRLDWFSSLYGYGEKCDEQIVKLLIHGKNSFLIKGKRNVMSAGWREIPVNKQFSFGWGSKKGLHSGI